MIRIDPEFHALIPELSRDELEQLRLNILDEGCRDALVVWQEEGLLLDGHNRYAICTAHNIPFQVVYLSLPNRQAAIKWILTNQTGRRNLSSGQRAALAVELLPILEEEARERQRLAAEQTNEKLERKHDDTLSQRIDEASNGRASDKAAELFSTNRQYVSDAKKLEEEAPDLFEKVKADKISLPKAKRELASRQPKPETPPLPSDKYRCIVIDPPWPIQKIDREVRPKQGIGLDYPIMSLEEIAALPIENLAAEDGCHLYLWVTQKFLPAGLELVQTWGFTYQCLMTWVKNVGMTPYSWMYDTEHVIFARRGNLPLAQMGLRLSFAAKVNGHSVKPEVFYDERVLMVSPEPRLEMFARRERAGFTVWGNEICEPM